jgi:formimidoylglutamate deiminase
MSRRGSELDVAIWFSTGLLSGEWCDDVRIIVEDGMIARIDVGVRPGADDDRQGAALPGLPNVHSHAFQRAMAGRTEGPVMAGRDDFWSWRELMYALVGVLTPEDIEAIAAMAFAEMLEGGFTRVGEFHYLHHDTNGAPYADPAQMARAVAAAAGETGIALTLMPVFYAHSGFGGMPPLPEQRRFVSDLNGFSRLLEGTRAAVADLADGVVGVAPHSLRAVTPSELDGLCELSPLGPIHMHIAEQIPEVEACLAWSGARPVRWLMDHAQVDERWCLIHATHVKSDELAAISSARAVVGLCPITEANLGDGLFPASDFLRAGGRWGIGSDSNVRIDAAEELRLLEYGQRLFGVRRNVLSSQGHSTGRTLFEQAFRGGAQALGAGPSGLTVGAPADIVALAADGPAERDGLLDQWIFARGSVQTVWRAGRKVVDQGRHVGRDAINARYRRVLERLVA